MKQKTLRFLDTTTEYAIYGVIFFIPISIALISAFAGIASTSFILKSFISKDLSDIKSNKILFIILLIFFIFMGLSLFNSGPFIAKSVKALLFKWGKYPFFIWAIIGTFKNTKRITNAMLVFFFSSMLLCLAVVTQKFMGFDIVRRQIIDSSFSPVTGPFKNQNALAAYLTTIIPIILSLSLWRWNNIVIKASLFITMGMLFISSFWTSCRGGWVGLITGLIYLILLNNHNRVKKSFVLIFFSTFIFLIPSVTLIFYFLSHGKEYRFLLAQGAWQMITENPILGKGIGTFMDYCSRYTNNLGPLYAHNCYLQMWAESGIFSLLSFLCLVGYVLYCSIKLSFGMTKSLSFFILTGLTAGFLGFLVHSSFEVHLYSFQLSFIFWTILGLIVALVNLLKQENTTSKVL